MPTNSAPDENGGLPKELGDGLTLRWATPADTEALAEFNIRHLSDHVGDQPAVPNPGIGRWVRRMMSGTHPTTSAGDFTVVVDERAGDRIVSSLCLIAQTWSYAGIPFQVGRPEAVSTSPAYRRRGLVRAQFDAIHARSAARGDLMQAITGIAWYYRQFGYEMTLPVGGSRRWLAFRIPPAPSPEQSSIPPPSYRLRRATAEDIPLLARLYPIHCEHMLVARLRNDAEWRFELERRQFWVVEDAQGAPVGYAEASVYHGDDDYDLVNAFTINEVALQPGHSLRAVLVFLGQAFQAHMAELAATQAEPLTTLALNLGPEHPAYAALGNLIEQYRPAWTWYIRVPDLPAFVRHIAPVLERRLAASALAGHSGTLRLNFYRAQMTLVFQGGRLVEIGSYTPTGVEDGDAHFPDLTFLHVLLGHRTLAELNYIYQDCYANPLASNLLGILFPKQPSNPVPLS